MLKNSVSVAHLFIMDTATGLGVPSLTAAGSFTSIKLCQDGTLGSDIKATLTGWADLGGGFYSFALTAAMTNYGVITPIVIPSTATYQGYGVTIYTETAARAGDAMIVTGGATELNVTAVGVLATAIKTVTDKLGTMVEAVP